MMREYKDRKNVQAKVYYKDRFYVVPQIPKEEVDSDEIFSKDMFAISKKVDVKEAYIQKSQLVIILNNRHDIVELAKLLKERLTYTQLSEMSASDFLAERGEFEVFYQFLSMEKRKRIRVKYSIKEDQAIDSLYDIYKSADWAERELYDMMGIVANGHPNLKRLIMPDDWVGHPLRKTYPLQGDENAQWYEIDTIFGKEYRDVVGPEIRDTKRVDQKDTEHFARIGKEVPKGANPKDWDENYDDFQEEDGVKLFGVRLVTRFTKKNQKLLTDRK